MHQVDLIRRYSLRKVKELRIFISCLPTREQEALEKLGGVEGAKTAARIADFILQELGHKPPAETPKQSPTMRAAVQILGTDTPDVTLQEAAGRVRRARQ